MNADWRGEELDGSPRCLGAKRSGGGRLLSRHIVVENVWEYLRKKKLANRLYQTYEDIVEACCEAWNSFIAMPEQIASIASRGWARVS